MSLLDNEIHKIDTILGVDGIVVVYRDDLEGEYIIKIRDLNTEVHIQISSPPGKVRFDYRASHAIATPTQAGPYNSSVQCGNSVSEALAKAIRDLTSYYDAAVRAGFEPEEKWLSQKNRY